MELRSSDHGDFMAAFKSMQKELVILLENRDQFTAFVFMFKERFVSVQNVFRIVFEINYVQNISSVTGKVSNLNPFTDHYLFLWECKLGV